MEGDEAPITVITLNAYTSLDVMQDYRVNILKRCKDVSGLE